MSACRLCGADLERIFVDLGSMPLANSYLDSVKEIENERTFPLLALLCETCMLVQVEQVVEPDVIFSDYAYFSSFSPAWVEHARKFAGSAMQTLRLDGNSLVIEVGSNDGYLLRHFLEKGVKVLGIEPAVNVAAAAVEAAIPTEVDFFGCAKAEELVERGLRCDLLVVNNVFAHVPDLHDFTEGLALALKPAGVLSMEFPHLLRLLAGVQFDTIYHEHLSYFSLLTAERTLRQHGLAVFDAEELPTHGGSLRLWASKEGAGIRPSGRLESLRLREEKEGIDKCDTYERFTEKVDDCRTALLDFFKTAAGEGKSVAGYGAAAKGNTLLNFCGVSTGEVEYVADRNPHKQGKLLPGSHIPIVAPDHIDETRPEYLLTIPWNLKEEIFDQMRGIRRWGGRFVVPLPELQIIP